MELNENQKKRIKNAIESQSFDIEIQNLVDEGFTKEEATLKMNQEVDLQKQLLSEQGLASNEIEQKEYYMFIALLSIAIAGPLWNINFPIWHITSVCLSGVLGYFLFKKKPIAGVAGSSSLALTFPFFYNWYISLKGELMFAAEAMIPLFFSLCVSALLVGISFKIFYSNTNK